jgi:hypothetical protein
MKKVGEERQMWREFWRRDNDEKPNLASTCCLSSAHLVHHTISFVLQVQHSVAPATLSPEAA